MTPQGPAQAFLCALLSDNLVLGGLLGICTLLRSTRTISSALVVGGFTATAILVVSLSGWVFRLLFPETGGFAFMGPLFLSAVIGALALVLQRILRRIAPRQNSCLGDGDSAILTANTAVLAAGLMSVGFGRPAVEAPGILICMSQAVGAGTGFVLAAVLMAGIQARLRVSPLPAAMRGMPSFLLAAGLGSLVFTGFSLFPFIAGGGR